MQRKTGKRQVPITVKETQILVNELAQRLVTGTGRPNTFHTSLPTLLMHRVRVAAPRRWPLNIRARDVHRRLVGVFWQGRGGRNLRADITGRCLPTAHRCNHGRWHRMIQYRGLFFQ